MRVWLHVAVISVNDGMKTLLILPAMSVQNGSKEGRATLSDGPILLREDGSFSPQDSEPGSPSSPAKGAVFSFSDSANPGPSMPQMDLLLTETVKERDTKEGSSGLTFARTQFFGGGLECFLPKSFEDVSAVRDIPDHQEVYVDKETEMSFICELLTYETEVGNDTIAEYVFDDLASCNEAQDKVIDSQNSLVGTDHLHGAGPCFRCQLNGRQVVTKLSQERNTVADVVQIHLMILRLPKIATDILLSLNVPLTHIESTVNALSIAENAPRDSEQIRDILHHIMATFKVNDWALFA